MMTKYNIDCEKHFGQIETDDEGIIINTIPVFQKFVGQYLVTLRVWVAKNFGYCKLKEIKNG
jgi:hypothetical protein